MLVSRLRVNLVIHQLLELKVKAESLEKMEAKDYRVTQETLNKVINTKLCLIHY